jgi:hypothetical protein
MKIMNLIGDGSVSGGRQYWWAFRTARGVIMDGVGEPLC